MDFVIPVPSYLWCFVLLISGIRIRKSKEETMLSWSDKQPQHLASEELEELALGINRVRFLKNRIATKRNPIFQAVQNIRIATNPDCKQNPAFILSMDRDLPRPRTQLKQPRQKKASSAKESVQDFKKLKQCWNVESEKKKLSDKARRMMQCKSVRKAREQSREKVRKILQAKKFSIKCGKENHLKNKMSKDLQRIQKYEQRILLGQKIKEFIENKQANPKQIINQPCQKKQ